ncbi:hypothetical protein SDC9_159954 [bioreactor metagenome]|uniref:Uncharacterized protein n=1 Tax=bioreactor metagenome TaxID=1076179 RepID=A0A645FE11_9ZZZZ
MLIQVSFHNRGNVIEVPLSHHHFVIKMFQNDANVVMLFVFKDSVIQDDITGLRRKMSFMEIMPVMDMRQF